MRYGLHILGIALGIGLILMGSIWAYTQATSAQLTEDARLAIEVRCPDERSLEGRECETLLTKLYSAGALEPDRTLRAYCETVKTRRWQGSESRPPKLCRDRYGGW
jgi:hypothetical protein